MNKGTTKYTSLDIDCYCENLKNISMELPFNDPEFEKTWNEWLQYRKERKLPKYVPKGLQKTFTRLKNISGNDPQIAIKIINQSMEQNYQGLFPLSNNNGAVNQQTTSKAGVKQGTSAARIAAAKNY